MSSRTETYRAKWEMPFPTSFTKAERIDTRKLLTKSILSRFEPDLAGDVVNPAGIDWSLHQTDPWIDLEHGRDADVGDRPVAWGRESLSRPDAPYAVEYKSLNFAAPGEPALWETVPIGTDYFDPQSKLSMQIFAMRDQDALPCSSLEFLPVRGHFKAIGRTTMEPRPCMPDPSAAYQFDRCRVVRWTICAKGVCPHAMTLTKSAGAISQVPSMLEKILQDKCVNINGTREPLHEYILKALAPGHTKRSTVTVERKAMSPDYAATAAPTTEAPLETESAQAVDQMGGAPKPTVQAHYDFAQGMLDLIDQAEAQLESSEHVKGRKFLMKKFEKMRAEVDAIKANGDKIDSELSAGGAYGDDDEEGDDGSDADDDEADDGSGGDEEDGDEDAHTEKKAQPVERDAEGVLKGIRPEYTPKRFRLVDLNAANVVTPATEVKKSEEPSKEFDEAYAEFKKWKKWAKPKS